MNIVGDWAVLVDNHCFGIVADGAIFVNNYWLIRILMDRTVFMNDNWLSSNVVDCVEWAFLMNNDWLSNVVDCVEWALFMNNDWFSNVVDWAFLVNNNWVGIVVDGCTSVMECFTVYHVLVVRDRAVDYRHRVVVA